MAKQEAGTWTLSLIVPLDFKVVFLYNGTRRFFEWFLLTGVPDGELNKPIIVRKQKSL